MKTGNLFFVTLMILIMQSGKSNAWDTTAAKYYPLNVGNVYVFHEIDLFLNCSPFYLLSIKKVTIDDLVMKPNGKMYFKFSGWWPVGGDSPSWNYQRIDSNSMNVYSYDSITNSDVLIDSLLSNAGNTFQCGRFNSQSRFATCNSVFTANVLGTDRTLKVFDAEYFSVIRAYYSLAEGIGFVGFSSCEAGGGVAYNLAGCIIDGIIIGDTTLTGIHQLNSSVPDKFSLFQNYPNPFNPATVINYNLRISGFAKLIVYDVLGNEVKTLVNEKQNAGTYSVDFDGSGLSSGVYFYKLETGDFIEVKRMMLIK